MSVMRKGWRLMDNKTLMRIAKALERLIKLVEDDIKGVHYKKKKPKKKKHIDLLDGEGYQVRTI